MLNRRQFLKAMVNTTAVISAAVITSPALILAKPEELLSWASSDYLDNWARTHPPKLGNNITIQTTDKFGNVEITHIKASAVPTYQIG